MKLINKKELVITFIIVFLSFVVRVIRLDVPHDWSFDEVYHALSAEAYALNDPRGYEYWNESPKDLAWEWLHPPLGKAFMALSIKTFAKPFIPIAKSDPIDGKTAFAWRFPGTIFAALTVWLLIKFGKKLFNNFWIGAVAGGLYALDGLSFVQSRTGMNDIYVTFFVVLVFYRLYIFISDYNCYEAGPVKNGSCPALSPKKTHKGTPSWGSPCACHPFSDRVTRLNNFPCACHPLINLLLLGLAAGLAASTKWSGFYAAGIVFVWVEIFLLKKKDWKNLLWGLVCLGVVPVLVYFLSYAQWWWQGHTIKQFYELHQQIWWYQTGLKATHDYQSTALTWPFLYRPVWFYVKYQDIVNNGIKTLYIGNIYTMGNPIVWWAGLLSILYLVFSILGKAIRGVKGILGSKGENLGLGIILVGYFGMFAPWALSPRIMFLYHYLPSVPFLCLILAYGLNRIRLIGPISLIGGVKGEYIVTAYLTLAVFAFIYFYPHWSALLMPQSWVDQYYWLPKWK